LVAVNCGAFADTLLDSELFGHVRGAFTGAVQDRLGVFEASHGGTLFLDEIGEVSPAMQVKLLRVIQEREVMRLGETKAQPVDVRLIAATNRDLLDDVAHQRYRHDLYYRLRVIDLQVPPLRERPEELLVLARDLLARTAARFCRPIVGYTPRALDRVLDYLWPGNIRELEHVIERTCAVATGPEIDVEDLPDVVRGSHAPGTRPDRRSLADREIAYIRAALDRHHGDRQRAAEELGISLSTLKRRLRHEGSDVPPRRLAGGGVRATLPLSPAVSSVAWQCGEARIVTGIARYASDFSGVILRARRRICAIEFCLSQRINPVPWGPARFGLRGRWPPQRFPH
jgi:two-component system response regulator HydG